MEEGEDRDMYGGEGGTDRGQKPGSTAGTNEDESGGGMKEQSLIAVSATPFYHPRYSVY